MSMMHHAAITTYADGSRNVHEVAAIVGVSMRVVRRVCRQLGLTLANS